VKAWLWFLSSYAPLWLMLALRFEPCALRIGFSALAVICAGVVAWLVARRSTDRPSNTSLTVTGDAGADISGYLAAYLLPFLTANDPTVLDLLAYLIFLGVAGLVYVRSGLMQINPTVYLTRRKVFRAKADAGGLSTEVFVISRVDLRVGEAVKGERFADKVYIHH
jgi:hypothetical protein